jgi:hypothetical protein
VNKLTKEGCAALNKAFDDTMNAREDAILDLIHAPDSRVFEELSRVRDLDRQHFEVCKEAEEYVRGHTREALTEFNMQWAWDRKTRAS